MFVVIAVFVDPSTGYFTVIRRSGFRYLAVLSSGQPRHKTITTTLHLYGAVRCTLLSAQDETGWTGHPAAGTAFDTLPGAPAPPLRYASPPLRSRPAAVSCRLVCCESQWDNPLGAGLSRGTMSNEPGPRNNDAYQQ